MLYDTDAEIGRCQFIRGPWNGEILNMPLLDVLIVTYETEGIRFEATYGRSPREGHNGIVRYLYAARLGLTPVGIGAA